jgi:hypothetical protein
MDRREDLERWIAASRRTQRVLRIGVIIAAVISIGLFFVSKAAGGIGLFVVVLVALSGFWITAGHIADWQDKLYKLDHPTKPAPGGKRRYQAD